MEINSDEDRKRKEAEFHSRRERLRTTDPEAYDVITRNRKYYAINRASKQFMDGWLKKHLSPESVALDYCCGTGANAIEMAKLGARVTGVDISSDSVASARMAARDQAVDDRTNFVIGDAEHTQFAADTFDVILCNGVLHHLAVRNAYSELARILKPGGAVFCVEALAHNLIFQLYRRMTPHMRTEWETGHILSRKSIIAANEFFDEIDLNFFHLLDLLAVPFRGRPVIFDPLLKTLSAIDRSILVIPGVKWWAWQCLFVLRRPMKK